MQTWDDHPTAEPDSDGVVRLLRVGAYAVCRRDDELLCCRLSPGEASPGSWTLPGGGVDFGEHPVVAVLRELEEETGLTGRVEAIASIESRLHGGRLPDGRSRELHAVAILFHVSITGGTLRNEHDGTTDRAAWLSRAELAEAPLVGLARRAVELAFADD